MIFEVLVSTFACLVLLPVLLLLFEVLSATVRRPARLAPFQQAIDDGSVAVVIPAHNESVGLLPTLADVAAQLRKHDCLLVIADNCSDDTAAVATQASAQVIERNDPSLKGKGYALAHAIAHLRDAPPAYVLFVDADCRLEAGSIQQLRTTCAYSGRPVQACYLMNSPKEADVDHSLAEFFWTVRNKVRPIGLSNFGLPVQLMGTGMIFPWAIIADAPLAHGHLVEDMKLGLDLGAAGYAPIFEPSATVTSYFPASIKGNETQRQRWIHGHLQMLTRTAPKYLLQAILKRDLNLAVLALDVMVPPVSMLLPLAVLAFVSGTIVYLAQGQVVPLLVSLVTIVSLTLALLLAWIKFGRSALPPRSLGRAALSAISKIVLYGRLYFGRKANTWIRTDRSHD